MKKYKSILMLSIIAGIITIVSCSKEEKHQLDKQDVENISPFMITSIDDILVKDKIINWQILNHGNFLTNLKTSQGGNIEFNYDDLVSASMEGVSGEVIVANQIGFDVANSVNHGIGFFENENNEIVEAMIIRTEQISENIQRIEYLNLNYELQLSVELDFLNKTSNIISQEKNTFKNDGAGTVECMEDVYSGHGWLSVWVIVQTAFIPATALAFAIACAVA